MQFKVPQNIDMADRIVGPLTLVQFLYVLVGGIIVYFLLVTIAPISSLLFLATAGPVTLFTLALAFLKIQDQPFPRFVGAFFMFLRRPKVRVWYKDGVSTELVITKDAPAEGSSGVQRKTVKRSELARLAQTLDTSPEAVPATSNPKAQSINRNVPPPNHLKRGRPTLDNVAVKSN